MEYSNLETYAHKMQALARGEHEFGPRRLAAEQDRNVEAMAKALRPTINKLMVAKNLRSVDEEVFQHARIAIHQAVGTWNPELASFSTHVYWQIRAELQTLQHNLFPARRKIKVQHPIRFVGLDCPIGPEPENNFTILDTLACDGVEGDVEASAREHMALHGLERILSHYLARKMTSFCASTSDLGKISEQRRGLMRNREIFLKRYLDLRTLEDICHDYGVTRERIRQVVSAVERDLLGQLPRKATTEEQEAHKKATKKRKAGHKGARKASYCDTLIIEATRPTPTDIHPSWPFFVAEYFAATGIDPRLIGRDEPLSVDVEEYDFMPAPSDEIEIEAAPRRKSAPKSINVGTPPAIEVVERIAAAPAPRHQMALDLDAGPILSDMTRQINEINASQKALPLNTVKRFALGLAAVGGLAGLQAAAQTSRAIPPSEHTVPASAIATQTQNVVQTSNQATRKMARPDLRQTASAEVTGPLQPMEKIITSRPAWGIRVAEFSTANAARSGWVAERRSWTWLRGLYPEYIAPNGAVTTHGVAFGPLAHEQAFGMCREARRLNKTCQVVNFGVTRSANASAARSGVDRKVRA